MIVARGDGWIVTRERGMASVVIDRKNPGATFSYDFPKEAPTLADRISALSSLLFEASARIEKKRLREAFAAEWE